MKTRFTIAMAAFLLTIGAATAYARKLYATFGIPASSATYKSPTYTWAANTNNLMPMFTFANGELANYKTLSFTFSDYKVESGSGGVRIGVYHTTDGDGSTWKQMGDSFYANGTKTIDLEAFAKESGVDLAMVTSICFGGSNGAGSVTLKPSEMYIAMGTSAIHDAGSETKATAAGVAYDLHGRLTKPNAKGMVIVGGKKHFNK